MKKNLITYFENKVRTLKLSKNGLSAEDAAVVEQDILDMQKLIEELKATEEEVTITKAYDELKKAIDEKIKAIEEKINENPNEPIENANYLASENSLHDFANALRNSNSVDGMSKAWGAKLSENGITFAEGGEFGYLPEYVKGRIQDSYEKNNWLGLLNNTNAKRFAIRYNTSAQTDETSRAKGHKSGTKAGESLTMTSIKVEPQMIYKIMEISNMTIFNDDESLINYVIDELMTQWVYEVQRAILVGDGRQASDTYKIDSVSAIVRSTTDAFVTVSQRNSSVDMVEDLVNLVANIENNGAPIVMFMSKANLNTLRKYVAASGATTTYVAKDVIAEMIGVSDIITTNVLGTNADAVAFVPSKYVTVGSIEPKMAQWENYMENTTSWRLEIPFGGAVEGLKSAAVLTPAGE